MRASTAATTLWGGGGSGYQSRMSWRNTLEPFARPLFFWWSRLTRAKTLGVRVLVQAEAGRVLLVRHTYLDGWYLPGGGVDGGETLFPG